MRNWLNLKLSRGRLPATEGGSQPGDFPLGSTESRAAARALLERAERALGTTIRATIVHIGQDGSKPPAPERVEWSGGVIEIRHVPGEGKPASEPRKVAAPVVVDSSNKPAEQLKPVSGHQCAGPSLRG